MTSRIVEVLALDGLVWVKSVDLKETWVAFVRLEHTQGMRRRGQPATLRERPVTLTVRRSCVVIQSTDERPPALSVGDELSWNKEPHG